jgi:hypothetical protein
MNKNITICITVIIIIVAIFVGMYNQFFNKLWLKLRAIKYPNEISTTICLRKAVSKL